MLLYSRLLKQLQQYTITKSLAAHGVNQRKCCDMILLCDFTNYSYIHQH